MRKIFPICAILFFLFASNTCVSQSFSINTTGAVADTSAILDIKSSSKGLLIPRVTNTQKNTIFSPAVGLLVYQTDGESGFYYYTGTIWLLLPNSNKTSAITTLVYTTKGF